jgi:hypothetical protein
MFNASIGGGFSSSDVAAVFARINGCNRPAVMIGLEALVPARASCIFPLRFRCRLHHHKDGRDGVRWLVDTNTSAKPPMRFAAARRPCRLPAGLRLRSRDHQCMNLAAGIQSRYPQARRTGAILDHRPNRKAAVAETTYAGLYEHLTMVNSTCFRLTEGLVPVA